MASKLIQLNEAAEMLGVSPDELNDMRSRSEIFGYRDGATWKFKMDEVERVAASKGIELKPLSETPTPAAAGGSGIDADLDELFDVSDLEPGELADDDDPATIFVDGADLEALDSSAETAIGKPDLPVQEETPVGGSDVDLGAASSDVALVADSGVGNSDVRLVAGSSDVLSSGASAGSHVLSGGDGAKGPSDTAEIEEPEELLLDDELELGDEELTLGE